MNIFSILINKDYKEVGQLKINSSGDTWRKFKIFGHVGALVTFFQVN